MTAKPMLCAAFVGFVAFGCGDGDNGADAGAGDASIDPNAKRMFVTSSDFRPDLRTAGGGVDGIDGGDKICANAAVAEQLGGAWKVWLSDSSRDAIDRIADVGPWVTLDRRTMLFGNKANLTTTPEDEDWARLTTEKGDSLGPGMGVVWTGTRNGGRRGQEHCTDWTSDGAADLAVWGGIYLQPGDAAEWTFAGTEDCDGLGRLYCLEQ